MYCPSGANKINAIYVIPKKSKKCGEKKREITRYKYTGNTNALVSEYIILNLNFSFG